MNVLLVPVGSAGDIHPYIGLGQALKERGHSVKVLTCGYFEPLVRRAGLEYVEVGTRDDYLRATNHPDLWDARKGFKVLVQIVLPLLRTLYDRIAEHYVAGETVMAASALAFSARIAQEKLGVPLATVHLCPMMFRSAYHSPVLPNLFQPDWTPRWWKRFVYYLADVLAIDRVLGPPINQFRGELGLAPVRRIFDGWSDSPQRVLGLFPQWFGPPQPDWPAQTRLTGFPLFDESGVAEMPQPVVDFLYHGDPPVVFFPGSAMQRGENFFEESVAACQQLGRRGLLLTRFTEQLPRRLPAGILHAPYVPFSQLLPRAAVLVHHGGIGTAAQALAAGVPQLVRPMSFDQFDNADRLVRLGVGDCLSVRAYRGPEVARRLEHLLTAPTVGQRCQEVAQRLPADIGLEKACRVLEELAGDLVPSR
jgi:rhamnosyltransferase subunit B